VKNNCRLGKKAKKGSERKIIRIFKGDPPKKCEEGGKKDPSGRAIGEEEMSSTGKKGGHRLELGKEVRFGKATSPKPIFKKEKEGKKITEVELEKDRTVPERMSSRR